MGKPLKDKSMIGMNIHFVFQTNFNSTIIVMKTAISLFWQKGMLAILERKVFQAVSNSIYIFVYEDSL